MPPNAPETCPKCSRPRLPGSSECSSCGVVYGRFRAITRPAPLKTVLASSAETLAPVAPAATAAHVPAPPRAAASQPPAHVSRRQAETVLRLIAHSLESGLTLSAFARTGGLMGLPPATAARLTADADAGVPLSQTLEDLGLVDSASAGLLRAKEQHGGQTAALVAIADRIASRRTARNRLLLIAAYPYLLMLALTLIRPAPVGFSHGLAAYLAAAMPGFLTLVGLPVGLFAVLPRVDPGGVLSSLVTKVLGRIPFLGSGPRNDALASFVDVLGASVSAGVSVREALPLAAKAGTVMPGFDEAWPRAVAALDAGASLSQALAQFPGLPPTLVAQISAGEASGRLDEVLVSARKELEGRAKVGWMGLAFAVGGVLVVAALGTIVVSIITGFQGAMTDMSNAIDVVAPPP